MPVGKFSVLVQRYHLGIYVPGIKISKLWPCRVGDCLLAPRSVCVGALRSCCVGLWLPYLLKFILCASILDSAVFVPTRVLERPKKSQQVESAAASSAGCQPLSQKSLYLFSLRYCRLQNSQESSSSGEL